MNSYAQSLRTVLRQSRPLPLEPVFFGQAGGRVLAQAFRAPADDPPVSKSRMDGFAIRAEDSQGAYPQGPRHFRYQEVVGAGQVARQNVGPGEAVRLMTGAWLPSGADAVVKQEDAHLLKEGAFALTAPLAVGENVMPAASQVAKGDLLLPAGEVIGPSQLGVLAGAGMAWIQVRRAPRVALLALGDELTEPGHPLRPGALYVSNLYELEARVARQGALPRNLGIVADDPELIANLLRPHLPTEGLADPCDVLLTLGGSHGGDFDYAERVLKRLGAKLHFRRTRLSPGGSTLFATLGGGLLFGLPGSPQAALGAFELLVRPAIKRLAGRRGPLHQRLQARLQAPLAPWRGGSSYEPAHLAFHLRKGALITPLRGNPRKVALANAFIEIREGAPLPTKGERVTVLWREAEYSCSTRAEGPSS